jgi:sugar phosphate permease
MGSQSPGPDRRVLTPETSRVPASPRYCWYIVGMLWCISFFNYADRQAIFSVFPLLEREMGLTKTELGLLGSSFAWVYGLGAPFAGAVIDRVRRKTAILGGLHVWSVICLATALSRRFRDLVFFRAAEGLGETFYYPASVSMLSDYHGQATRSRALGIHQTSVYVGTIAGGFFAGLIGQYYGWRWSFVIFGAMGIFLGLLLQRYLHEPRRGAMDGIGPGFAEQLPVGKPLSFRTVLLHIARTPTALLLMLAFLYANFVAMVLLSWMPAFLAEKFQMSLALAGLTATVFAQLASLLGAPLGGWLADMLRQRTPGGRILIQAVGVLGGAPFVYWCGQTQSVFNLVLILTAWGLFKGLYDANIFAALFDVIPLEARGRAAGLMNMFGWLGGGATAPVIIGFLADVRGLGWAISSAALVYVAAGLLLLFAAFGFAKHDIQRQRSWP